MKLLPLILFLLLGIITFASGQEEPCFKAYDTNNNETFVFCVGQKVSFQDCGDIVPDDKEYYVFDYKNGTAVPILSDPVKEHIYTTPGIYRVLQIANYGGTILTDTVSRVFEVKTTTPPAFTAIPCANQAVAVTITDQQYDTYTIDYGDGTQHAVKGETKYHTYATPGPYNVTVTGKHDGATCISSPANKIVDDLPSYSPPTISKLEVLNQDATTGEIRFTYSTLVTGYNYTLTRKLETDANFTAVATLMPNQSSYTLSDANTTLKAVYKIEATDACDADQLSSNEVGNIVLNITTADEQNSVQWQSSDNFQRIELYRENALLGSGNPASPYLDKDVAYGETHCYEIRGINADGAISASAEQCIEVTDPQDVQLHVPSAFTPNNDGLNDFFEVKGRYIRDYSIRIYNGMGEQMFTSNDITISWDGTHKGSPLPAGAYAYEIRVTSPNKQTKRRTGTITILR